MCLQLLLVNWNKNWQDVYKRQGQALCMVNGQQTDKIQDIPLGAGVTGVVDPLTQTLQRINVQYAMYTGIVTKVGDANHKTLQLEGISGTFTIEMCIRDRKWPYKGH